MEGHDIELRPDGIYWCNTEDVDANECADENRCSNECCCNSYPYEVTYLWVVEAKNPDLVPDAVEEYVHSVSDAFDNPVSVVRQVSP